MTICERCGDTLDAHGLCCNYNCSRARDRRLLLDPGSLGERGEMLHCRANGRPWRRLTPREQEKARELGAAARYAGHRHLMWIVPAQPWPVGAVWPEWYLWGIEVARVHAQGALLTARLDPQWWRPWHVPQRYVVAELRPASVEFNRNEASR